MGREININIKIPGAKFVVQTYFWLTILFSMTALKHIWGVEAISSAVNLFLIIGLICMNANALFVFKYMPAIWYFLITPSLLVIGGIFLNIIIFALSEGKFSSSFTMAIPWLAYLPVVYWERMRGVSSADLWCKFYQLMLVINILCIFEYLLVFGGFYSARAIVTPYGEFLAGNFSLFFPVNSEEIHYRYYACFLEPGALAMYLLPAIVYSIFYKKIFGLVIFSVALYMTDSLGGYISYAMIFVFIPLIICKNNRILFMIPLVISLIIAVGIVFGDNFLEKYEGRGNSSEVREQTFLKTMETLPSFVVKNPFGIPQVDSTDELSKNPSYLGTTFTPAIYLQTGGMISFLGYITVLIVSLFLSLKIFIKRNILVHDKIVLTSLLINLPFIFQRNTFWESPIFALLFLPTLIRCLNINKISSENFNLSK